MKNERASTLTADFGMIKRFELAKEEGHHTVELGLSVMNFTGNDLNYTAFGQSEKDQLDAPFQWIVWILLWLFVNKQESGERARYLWRENSGKLYQST